MFIIRLNVLCIIVNFSVINRSFCSLQFSYNIKLEMFMLCFKIDIWMDGWIDGCFLSILLYFNIYLFKCMSIFICRDKSISRLITGKNKGHRIASKLSESFFFLSVVLCIL